MEILEFAFSKMPKLKRIGERLKQQKEGLSRKKLIQRECDKSKRGSSRSSGKSCGKSKRVRKRSRWQCAKDAHGKWHIIRCPLSEEEDKLCECEEERKRGKREKDARDEEEKKEKREWEEELEERGEEERKRGTREKDARDEKEKEQNEGGNEAEDEEEHFWREMNKV